MKIHVLGPGCAKCTKLAESVTIAAKELGINPEIGRPEHHEYRWVSGQRANALLNPRLRQVLHWALDQIAATASPETPGSIGL